MPATTAIQSVHTVMSVTRYVKKYVPLPIPGHMSDTRVPPK
jgi:hypothetical protein